MIRLQFALALFGSVASVGMLWPSPAAPTLRADVLSLTEANEHVAAIVRERTRDESDGDQTAALTTQAPSNPPNASALGQLDVNGLAFVRSDSFGILLRAGRMNSSSAGAPVWFIVQTVEVPDAYKHCLIQYKHVERAELRLTIGGATSVQPFQRLANGTLAVAIPPTVLASATSGSILGWESGANPSIDDEAVLHVSQ